MHLFRLFYVKLYKVKVLHATATVPHEFVRPLSLYSKLHAGAVLLPTFILNLLGVFLTFDGWWDNQLQMTMFESLILIITCIGLIAFEIYLQSPRRLLHKPSDENLFFRGMFKKNKDKKKVSKVALNATVEDYDTEEEDEI